MCKDVLLSIVYDVYTVHKTLNFSVDEIKRLRKELEDLKSQRDKYADMLKHAGMSLVFSSMSKT